MMKYDPFFSVVMPVYNVEKHLEKAIESVLSQTYQDFEIILVDDSSPDGSAAICDKYSMYDNRISVIHHEKNKGLSEARNSGLAKATGKYIWFMDSDDYVDSNLLEKVHKSLERNYADVVVFGLIEEYFDKNSELKYTKVVSMPETFIKDEKNIHEITMRLEENTLYGYAWNKFYRLEYLREQGLKFETITLIEDIKFNVQYFQHIQSMNLLDITPYHYGKRIDNSLTSKFVKDYFQLHEMRIRLIYEQYQSWGCCSDEIKKKLAAIYARYILSAMQRNCDSRANYTFRGRYQWNKHLFESDFFNLLKDFMEPNSRVMSIIMPLIKNKQNMLCLIVGRGVFVVKNKLPIVFAQIKDNK